MSSASPAESTADVPEQKSGKGRPAGTRNWTTDQVGVLLERVGKFQPSGPEGWKKVARAYNQFASSKKWSERDWESCRNKFKRLAAVKRPTGDPNIHDHTRTAKNLYRKIEGNLHVGSLGIHSEDLGDSSGDDGGSGAPNRNLSDDHDGGDQSSSHGDDEPSLSHVSVVDLIPANEQLPNNSRGAGHGSVENPIDIEPSPKRKPSKASDDNPRLPKLSKTVSESLPQEANSVSDNHRSRIRSTRGKLQQVQSAFSSMVKEVSSALTTANTSSSAYVTRDEFRDLRNDIMSQLMAMQRSLHFIEATLLPRPTFELEPSRFVFRNNNTGSLPAPASFAASPPVPVVVAQSGASSTSSVSS